MSNDIQMGPREHAARDNYADGKATWPDVLAAREQDQTEAQAAAEKAAKENAEQSAIQAREAERNRADAEKRAEAERARREAAPRKRLAEIRNVLMTPHLSPADSDALVRGLATHAVMSEREEAEARSRADLASEAAELAKELHADVPNVTAGTRRVGTMQLGVIVATAFRTRSWQKTATACFDQPDFPSHERLTRSDAHRDLFVATMKAIKAAGGPDLTTSRRELDAHLDGTAPVLSSPAAAVATEPEAPSTIGRIGKSIKDAFTGQA